MRLWRIKRVDLVVAVVFLTVGLIEELTAPHRLPYWWLRLGFAAALVVVRRAAPLATLLLDIAVVQVLWLPAEVDDFRVWQAFCLFIGLHTVGREIILRGPDRDPLWRRLLAAAMLAGTVAVLVGQRTTMTSDVFASAGYTVAAWLSGLLLQIQARRDAERATALAAAQTLRADQALADERARIARELHDMVAHSVTVMVLQAAAVRRRLGPAHDAERDLLAGVEQAGRDAVTELRRTLGLLRGADTAGTVPQRGLADLDELLDQIREAGVAVEVHTEGEPSPLPASLDLSAYRIIQEALTNVLKHSAARRATVTVGYGREELRLTITDAGGATRSVSGATGGHGLVGMRERAAMFGGRLTAGPEPGGGYRVAAALPLARPHAYADVSR
ncbi:sensor histidine kinase [Phytohabitans kaempferiae]|uniref:histidine kinase n=1 Tax=Phytohabitans kaempferiae TaxID=1620943 RepID=A0ABV6MH64_9ACTN